MPDAVGSSSKSAARRGRRRLQDQPAERLGDRRRRAPPDACAKAEEEARRWPSASPASIRNVDFNTVPSVIYTSPEFASVGQTEQQLKEGRRTRRYVPVLRTAARARLGDTTACKGLIACETKKCGVHIVGPARRKLIAGKR